MVCPIVGIGHPHPRPRKRVCLPPWTQRGEQHSLAVEEVGGPNADDWTEGLALCVIPQGLITDLETEDPSGSGSCTIIFVAIFHIIKVPIVYFFPLEKWIIRIQGGLLITNPGDPEY